jgi:hypothetical protein
MRCSSSSPTVVVKVVDDPSPVAAVYDQPKATQQAQLMGDGGRLRGDGAGQLVD